MRKWLVPLIVLAGALSFLWWHSRPEATITTPPASTRATPNPTALTPQTAIATPGEKSNAVVADHPSQPASSSAPALSAPAVSAPVEPLTPELANIDPGTVLEHMRITVRQYGAMFGGNPVGTNPEITRALQGDNPNHIDFLKADGNRVNSQGELVDLWGTPYFFHQLSGTEMEIRSAGPDRVMYTPDDLVIK